MHRYLLLKTFNNVNGKKESEKKRKTLTQESAHTFAKMEYNKFPGFEERIKKNYFKTRKRN